MIQHLPANWANGDTPGAGQVSESELDTILASRVQNGACTEDCARVSYRLERAQADLVHVKSRWTWFVALAGAACAVFLVGVWHA